MRALAAALLLIGLVTTFSAQAADLRQNLPVANLPPYPSSTATADGYDEALVAGSVPVTPPVPPVLDQVLTPRGPTPAVGGPVLVIPGLNGPSGPPVYPLLPFAFGYGY